MHVVMLKKQDLESSLADLRIYQTLHHSMWLITKFSQIFWNKGLRIFFAAQILDPQLSDTESTE